MKRYSEERKQSVLKKMMPPLNTPISQLVAETGISDCTLYTWRKEFRLKGIVVPGNGKNAEEWSSENKFAVVVETLLSMANNIDPYRTIVLTPFRSK